MGHMKEFLERVRTRFSTRIFSPVDLIIIPVAFSFAFIASALGAKVLSRYASFDYATYWPISVFAPRLHILEIFGEPSIPVVKIEGWHIVVALAVFFLFLLTVRFLSAVRYRLSWVIPAGVLLGLATTLVLGWTDGFITPIASQCYGGIQYYHDAIKITDALGFIRQYEQLQPSLLTHARTHPPGAVLTFYLLFRILWSPSHVSILPGLISIIISILSTSLSAFFIYGILKRYHGKDMAGFAAFMFTLLPAVQIYHTASLDALIACSLLGVLYFFQHPRPVTSIAGSIATLFLASFLSFGFLFILPVMAGVELYKNRSLLKSVSSVAGVAVIYAIVHALLHYNYLESFLIAARLENPNGFILMDAPVSYFITRIEGISEIILFLGPFMAVLWWRGMCSVRPGPSNLILESILGVVSLTAMLASGAFRTGETARCCLFIYPYLIFPVVLYLESIKDTARRHRSETPLGDTARRHRSETPLGDTARRHRSGRNSSSLPRVFPVPHDGNLGQLFLVNP
jgi:hypothetical protein